eukprot:TRINITY_DN1140_c0_g1_i1.p1 TRINITY_DN1140_c0_g1~~TRINITY_DN1140_c0_g1_i1.p1  ORF type:complete len:519 (-),score=98.48 TRINITY_DN1140_c0_g1_i1:29-1585(-)
MLCPVRAVASTYGCCRPNSTNVTRTHVLLRCILSVLLPLLVQCLTPATPSQGAACQLAPLTQWLLNNGADLGGGASDGAAITLDTFPEQRVGLRAARDLDRLATVASIPLAICLTSGAGSSATGSGGCTNNASHQQWAHAVFARAPPEHQRQATVALKLAVEACLGGRSFYAPYIAVLPSAAELNLPVLWPPSEQQLLRRTLLAADTAAFRARLRQEFQTVRAALPHIANAALRRRLRNGLTARRWAWARCAVMSRAYMFPDGTYALVPLADFCNHSDGVAFGVERGDGVFASREEVVFTTDREYAAGAQVFGTYGAAMTTAKKLFSFGYAEGFLLSRQHHLPYGGLLPHDGTIELPVPSTGSDANNLDFSIYFNWSAEARTGDSDGAAQLSAVAQAAQWLSATVLPLLREHGSSGSALRAASSAAPAQRDGSGKVYVRRYANRKLRALGVVPEDILSMGDIMQGWHDHPLESNSKGVAGGGKVVVAPDKHVASGLVRVGEALAWHTVVVALDAMLED